MRPPQDDIYPVLDKYLPKLRERDVLFITSKVLAIHQGRSVAMGKIDKVRLIKQEADSYITKPVHSGGKKFYITIKEHTLIPSAGIDESNGRGYYILWPQQTNTLLKELWAYLRKKNDIKNLGIVATDSHTTPMRRGTIGISTGFYGLEPLRDYRGKKDIFSRKLKHTQTNLVDALSAAAVMLMGEGKETRPLVVVRDVPELKFTDKSTTRKLVMPFKQDIYYPLLKSFHTNPGRGRRKANAKTKTQLKRKS
jgi:F420-0:gamma-glutamyl ligase